MLEKNVRHAMPPPCLTITIIIIISVTLHNLIAVTYMARSVIWTEIQIDNLMNKFLPYFFSF